MFIYKITNTLDNKIYVGLTRRTIEARFKQHIQDSKKPNKNIVLYNAMRKHGIENFKVEELYQAKLGEDLEQIEHDWMVKLNSFAITGGGYNVESPLKNLRYLPTTGKKVGSSSQYTGVYKMKRNGLWTYTIQLKNGKFKHKENYKTEVDAAIARDLEIMGHYCEKEFYWMLNFPKDVEKYKRGDIPTPPQQLKNQPKKSKYIGVFYIKSRDSWIGRVLDNNKKDHRTKTYMTELDAAHAQDILSISIFDDPTILNFPDNYSKYLSGEILPKNYFESRRADGDIKRKHITFVKNPKGKKPYYLFRMFHNKKKYQHTHKILKDIIDYRNEILTQLGKPIPD